MEGALTWISFIDHTQIHNNLNAAAFSNLILDVSTFIADGPQQTNKVTFEVCKTFRIFGTT